MNRKTFFTSILAALGVAKAQDVTSSGGIGADTRTVYAFDLEPRKAKNNQCPTCGTMAEAFPARPRGRSLPWPPPPHITRCAQCNNAFWQDAE